MEIDLKKLKNVLAKRAFGTTKASAIIQGICISCHRPPVFHTELGVKEYAISAMCEDCFDELFKEAEENDNEKD